MRFTSDEAKCPFYKRENGSTVFCEGTESGSALHLAFGCGKRKRRYCRAVCRGESRECLIARAMLEFKYGEP